MIRRSVLVSALASAMLAFVSGAALAPGTASAVPVDRAHPSTARFATFNASLNRPTEGKLLADLSTPNDPQAAKVAEVVQRERPDVLLLNEFDYVSGNRAADAFRRNYLDVPQHGAAPIDYPYAYTAPVNTGVPSGFDLDHNGTVGGAEDAFGFGAFPGQYGLVVYSKYPIDAAHARTFQHFRWKDMPGALLPKDPKTGQGWYSPEVLNAFRLSSKSHWDLPIRIGTKTVHFLVSHPTPPSFDGPEDRNGTRNHDEIRLWADYINGGAAANYLYDDVGRHGGLAPNADFVVAGDQNSDPVDGDSVPGATNQLLHARRVLDPRPGSLGAVQAAKVQGGANVGHQTPSRLDTGDFDDKAPGNIRTDYVLPSFPLIPLRSGVFWPTTEDPLSRLSDASDHHSVWVDLLLR